MQKDIERLQETVLDLRGELNDTKAKADSLERRIGLLEQDHERIKREIGLR